MLNYIEEFDIFIFESFADGNQTRELRLSNKELEHFKDKYPNATVRRMPKSDNGARKCWYQITVG